MFTPSSILRSCVALLALGAGALADTITLKNGDKIDGKIIQENDAQITVEIQVTASIKDERVLKRDEIAKIDKVKLDEQAFAQIKNIALGEDSLERTDYDAFIQAFEGFISQYPASPHAKTAKAKADEFRAEKKRVEGGEIKEKGKWLSKEEVAEERVQISGRILLNRMKRYYAAGQLSEAMNAFDALDKNFSGAYVMPDAILLARQIVPVIKAAAEREKERLKGVPAERKRRLEVAQGTEQQTLAGMFKREDEMIAAAVKAEEQSGIKWRRVKPSNDSSLSSLISRASSEMSMLNAKPVDQMRESIKASEAARSALAAKDVAAAEKALTDATNAWNSNEVAKRLQPKLIAARSEAAAAAAAEASKPKEPVVEEKPKPTEVAAPAADSATVESTPVPDADPFYTQPIFWVVVGLLGLFGTLGFKAWRKFSDPNKNVLDQ